jgi:hypothetical protein
MTATRPAHRLGTDEQTDTVTSPKSHDHDRPGHDPVVIEAPTAEVAAVQPAEDTNWCS